MQKITYENYSNGLTATFSNDNPRSFLAAFDGSSTPCTAITYKPAEFDGERFISAYLNARTITFTAMWHGERGGKLSPAGSYAKWDELQRVFVPGKMGKLTWTNGSKSRFIECRTAELPNFSRVVGNKLTAEFKLVADYPYWQDVNENSLTIDFTYASHFDFFTITNECGIDVPFVFRCVSPVAGLGTHAGTIYVSTDYSGELVIDTLKCTATINGENANQFLGIDSEFFKLPPGESEAILANLGDGTTSGGGSVNITWHDHFIGVS